MSAGIYIHVPFCASKCGYCDFYSCTRLDLRDRVCRAILGELEARRDFIPDRSVRTIYIGGGTPSLLTPAQLQAFIDRIKELWDCGGLEEATVELNPDDMDEGFLERLAETDIDRLSIGIQSFADHDLLMMGRRHDANKAATAVADAQKAGFDNISVDLIYGIPGMGIDRWRDNLRRVFDLGVQHLSAYHLSIEPGTPFARSGVETVDDRASEEQFLLLHKMAADAGMEHYEISNFALPGRRARHNSAYWSGVNYLGVGPSAHSYNGSERSWSVPDVDAYLSGGRIYDHETLSDTDRYNEAVMLSLRRAEGIDPSEIAERFGDAKRDEFLRNTSKLIEKGLLDVRGGNYAISFENFLISDRIISSLFSGSPK